MQLTIIPDVVSEQELKSLAPEDTALDAARVMAAENVSAVIVQNADGELLGIVTERDLSRRVVGEDARGSEVRIADILTRDPITVAPGDTPAAALARMREFRIRHIPVVAEGKVVGMVSIRDLQQTVSRQVVAV